MVYGLCLSFLTSRRTLQFGLYMLTQLISALFHPIMLCVLHMLEILKLGVGCMFSLLTVIYV